MNSTAIKDNNFSGLENFVDLIVARTSIFFSISIANITVFFYIFMWRNTLCLKLQSSQNLTLSDDDMISNDLYFIFIHRYRRLSQLAHN